MPDGRKGEGIFWGLRESLMVTAQYVYYSLGGSLRYSATILYWIQLLWIGLALRWGSQDTMYNVKWTILYRFLNDIHKLVIGNHSVYIK